MLPYHEELVEPWKITSFSFYILDLYPSKIVPGRVVIVILPETTKWPIQERFPTPRTPLYTANLSRKQKVQP